MQKIAYINAQNVHKATAELGWIIDWGKFYKYLQNKFGGIEVKIFFGYIGKYQKFYDKLQRIGYTLVFKEVAIKPDGTIKGNVDIDIAMVVMEDLLREILESAVIITGDAGFNTLVSRLYQEHKLSRLIVPNAIKTSRFLRHAAHGKFQSLTEVKSFIQKIDS